LPLGTRIRITRAAPYNGTYWVLDTGSAIRKHRLDVYIPDCAAARQFGRRSVNVTVIPPQALLMMNAEWVVDRARAIAQRLQTEGASCEEDFVKATYARIFSRKPSSDELRIGVQFLREQRNHIKLEGALLESEQEEQAAGEALMDYCHVLLNANEFIYVE
jgi:hypothetical protein